MTLFEEWDKLMDSQTDDTIKEFWAEYSGAETKIYTGILDNWQTPLTGTVKDLAEKYEVSQVLFMGFLDGIFTSLNTPIEFKEFDENSEVSLDINFEKLYFNMLDAKADYLYGIPAWDNILTEEKRAEITKAQKKSKTVVKEKLPGRNDPCPCGSGKKYKKCCGVEN